MSESPLDGFGVLVTRPADQSQELVEAIESRGGHAINLPVLKIEPRPKAEILRHADALDTADIVVFVSTNAVRYGFDAFDGGSARIAVIGPATARAVEERGARVDIRPDGGADSEHLLASAELQALAGKTVTIVRGQSGRELLAETLARRGANVQYLSAYRRCPRSFTDRELTLLDRAWEAGNIDAVVVMSVASLDALLDTLPAAWHARLARTPLVGPGERMIQTALERLPDATCVQSPGPGALDVVAALTTVRHQDRDHD